MAEPMTKAEALVQLKRIAKRLCGYRGLLWEIYEALSQDVDLPNGQNGKAPL